MRKWNHYTCKKCGGVTVARHDDEGVTPFVISCRAGGYLAGSRNARVSVCGGPAESAFFDCSQDDNQTPHVIFYRPEPAEAMKEISKKKGSHLAWLLEHYRNGGSLMRDAPPAASTEEGGI